MLFWDRSRSILSAISLPPTKKISQFLAVQKSAQKFQEQYIDARQLTILLFSHESNILWTSWLSLTLKAASHRSTQRSLYVEVRSARNNISISINRSGYFLFWLTIYMVVFHMKRIVRHETPIMRRIQFEGFHDEVCYLIYLFLYLHFLFTFVLCDWWCWKDVGFG